MAGRGSGVRRLFLERLMIVGKAVGMMVIATAFMWLVLELKSLNFHLSKLAISIIGWIGVIVLGCLLLYLVGMLIYGLIELVKWLFVEPFRKDRSEQ